ncbi:HAD-IA family hydrolase [Sphingomonas sp. AP4-R1]|nr:HAD-IA family hydrolase [Sphingomonas sp. AP4-R1]
MFENRTFAAFLFDMDGTILSSIASAERVWMRWAQEHGIDVATLFATMHGVRAIDTVARHAPPGVDPRAEADRITLMEIEDVEGTDPITGAAAFLNAIPEGRWAIVTSAPRALALARLRASGLPVPSVLVTAEDVATGKPSPEGYLLGAERLGVAAADCLVFEDAAAGIAAGEAAGATVCVITACRTEGAPADRAAIANYEGRSVTIDPETGGLRIIAF